MSIVYCLLSMSLSISMSMSRHRSGGQCNCRGSYGDTEYVYNSILQVNTKNISKLLISF